MNESSCCSTSSPAFGVVSALDFGHSDMCEVVSHCFNLHPPDDIWCEASFHMLICHLYIIFGEMSVKVFNPDIFFNVFIYFWERARQSSSRGGAEREGDPEYEAGSRLWAVSTKPDAGLELTNCEIMTWVKVRRLTDWANQAPHLHPFSKFIFDIERAQQGRDRERGRENPKQTPHWRKA